MIISMIKQRIKQLIVVSLAVFLLSGCDNSDKKETTEPEGTAVEQVVSPEKEVLTSNANLEDVHSSSSSAAWQNRSFQVLDAAEIIIDGVSNLVITFSQPLEAKQDFANFVRISDKDKGLIDGAWELSDNGLELRHRYLDPKRTLVLTVNEHLRAASGAVLDKNYQTKLTTVDKPPMINFSSRGSLLPSQSLTGLPVTTINVDKVDINFFRVKPDNLVQFLAYYGQRVQSSTWSAQEMLAQTDLIYSGRFDLKPRANIQENLLVDLSSIAALKQEGVYLAVMTAAGTYNESFPVTLFTISNIGVSAHSYNNNHWVVFAHALDSGKPLADVQISLFNQKNELLERAKTNEQGFLDITSKEAVLLLATDKAQTTAVNLDRGALDLAEFNVRGDPFHVKQLFAFGPRDLYRPGETLAVNALLRDADGKMLPDQPIKVEIFNANQTIVKEFIWQVADPTQVGFYQLSYPIANNAATGNWSVRFNLGDDDYRYYAFSVEDFLPERMALAITPPTEQPLVSQDNIDFALKGWYLYGAPASENQLQGHIYLTPQSEVPNLPGFKLGLATVAPQSKALNEIDTKLDSQGLATIEVDSAAWNSLHVPVKLSFTASLLDVGGRPVTRSAIQTLWPRAELPAIRPLFNEVEEYDWISDRYVKRATVDNGSEAEFEVAYVNVQGQKIASDDLTARFVRERRDYYWSNEYGNWQLKYNQKEFVVAEQPLKIAAQGVSKVAYRADNEGAYRLEIVDTATNQVLTSVRYWSGYSWDDSNRNDGPVRPDQVKLTLDKTNYAPGDTAIVHVEAPVAGAGYLAVETNSGILWRQDITVPEGGLDVHVPIADWQRYDIYLNAMIIRPSKDVQATTIKRAVGLLHLPLKTDDRKLALTLDVPAKVLPETTASVKIKLDPQQISADRPISVLLSAVDSGVLNITNFKTPDPFTAFLGRKGYQVDQYDVYSRLIEGKGRLAGLSFGGDAVAGGKKTLTDVKIIAQQLKIVTLDNQGEAVVELPLPDFNGELRLMAQVWDQQRFGKAEQPLQVVAPFIVELASPRFLSGGDRSMMALDLRNLQETAQNIQVDISVSGLLALEQPTHLSYQLAAKARQIVQIPVIADYGYGQGKIDIAVNGVKLADGSAWQTKRNWMIGVRPAYAAEQISYSQVLQAGEQWQFNRESLNKLLANTVEGQLIISNQPPLNIAQYIKTLLAYPYGCLEQTISGLFPSLYANQEQLTQLGIKSETDDVRRDKVQFGIDRILTMQRDNGSFGLWSKESTEEYWLSVYATDFLLQAQARGYQVNRQALNKALTRLGEYLYDNTAFSNISAYSYRPELNDYIRFATKTYAALLLTEQNKITPAVRNEFNRLNLAVQHDGNKILKSALPVVQLALAMKNAGYTQAIDTLLPLAFDIERDDQAYWLGDYGSEIRDQAQILSLLMKSNLAPAEQSAYLLALSRNLQDQRYLSTQELNAVFIAGWLVNQTRTTGSYEIRLNDQPRLLDKPLSRAFSYEDLSHGLTIDNRNEKAPIYLRFDVTGYNKQAPQATSASNVLTVKRRYFDLNGQAISAQHLNVGDLLVVMLEVNAKKELSDALIVDLLPAGLELENQNLTNSSVLLANIPAIADLINAENSDDIKYQEYRDDRYVTSVGVHDYVYNQSRFYRKRVFYLARAVTPGHYMVPAPFVESMYHPDWFAIGSSLDLMTISNQKSPE